MRKCAFFWVVVVILAFQAGTLTGAQADVAGRLTLVAGRVDILKGGQLPATPAKVNNEVQTGDVIRTKSLSKAPITFIDNSTLTISPESRVAIEEYMFDPAKQKRSTVLQIFQGLAHVVVNKVYQVKDPDFIVKTNTAIMGVRGTDFGIRILPNSSTILNFKGRLQVGNIFPEVSQLSRRAVKVAYSFGPGGEGGPGWVILKDWQGTTVLSGLPPTMAFTITKEDWQLFKRQLSGGLTICRPAEGAGGGGECGGTATGALTGGESDTSGGDLGGLSPGFLMSLYSPAYTPPNLPPTTETPSPSPNNGGTSPTPPTYNFSLATYGLFYQRASGGTTGFLAAGAYNGGGASPVLLNAYGLAILQGDWGNALPSLYWATDSSMFTPTSGKFPRSMFFPGFYSSSIVGSVNGDLGGTLTGNATLESHYTCFRYQLSNSATILVTIDPSGQITYSYADGSFSGNIFGASISGTSSGEGTAYPWFGSATTASTTEGSDTMTAMAASSGPPVLTNNSHPELTGAPAIGDDALGSPGVVVTAGAHRRWRIKRNFFSPRDHNGRFKHRCASTPRPRHNLANLSRTGPMIGHFRGPGHGPTITNFARNCPITNPALHCSRHFPGNAPTLQRGAPGHRGGHHAATAQPVHRLKHKPPRRGYAHHGGQRPGALHRTNPPNHGRAPGPPQGPMTGPGAPQPGV